jgi:hypothetical protein
MYFLIAYIISLFIFCDLILYFCSKPELVRWYWIHAIGNFVVCLYTFTPLIELLTNPVEHIINSVRFDESTIIISLIHIYHLLLFKCTFADWVHHLTFVLLGTVSHYLVNYGYLTALYHFFICGLPGGIDYIALALVKDNIISKNTRLQLAVELNTWIRAPGIIMAWSFVNIWYVNSIRDWTHFVCYIIITLGSVVNAQYYSRQVTLHAGKKLTI